MSCYPAVSSDVSFRCTSDFSDTPRSRARKSSPPPPLPVTEKHSERKDYFYRLIATHVCHVTAPDVRTTLHFKCSYMEQPEKAQAVVMLQSGVDLS